MWVFFFLFSPSCYFTPLVNGWKTYSSAGTIIISFCRWLIAVHFRWMLITSKQSKTLHNNPALCRLVPLGTRCSYKNSVSKCPITAGNSLGPLSSFSQLQNKPCCSSWRRSLVCLLRLSGVVRGFLLHCPLAGQRIFLCLQQTLVLLRGHGFKSEWEDWDGNFALAAV